MNASNFFPQISLFNKGGKTLSILPINVVEFWSIFIAFIMIMIIIWFIVRELRCWYWKINLRTELLSDISCELKEIKEILKSDNKDKENTNIEKDSLEDFGLKIKE